MNNDIVIFYPLGKEVQVGDVSFRTTRETKQFVNSKLYELLWSDPPHIVSVRQIEKEGGFEFTVSLHPETSIEDIRAKFKPLLEAIPDFTINQNHA